MNEQNIYNEPATLTAELQDAAFEYLLLNPGSEFGDWKQGLISDYPTEVVDALGNNPEEEGLFRLSPKMLIRAAAFFQGKCLANFEDIGYSNIEEVTQALVAKFPADIPDRSMVQFKIVNLDNGKVYVYEHQKGKGF